MGRTLATMSQLLQQAEQEMRNFRRALRRADQPAFDDLWIFAHKHIAPLQMTDLLDPFESILFAMLVEERNEVRKLQAEVEQLKRRRAWEIRAVRRRRVPLA